MCCGCDHTQSVTPTAAQGRVTSPWCGGETRGGSPGLTRNLGGDLVQPRRPGHGIARPTPRRPPWESHDGTGRAPPGGGGRQVSPGSPCDPALSRARVRSPTPTHCTLCSAQVHRGVGISSYPTGPELGGGGIKGRQRRGGGKGQRLPLRCSLRRGNGTCLQPRRLAPQAVQWNKGRPPVPGPPPMQGGAACLGDTVLK